MPSVLTANRVTDGATVYLTPDWQWDPDLVRANRITDDQQREQLLRWARARETDVCDPYTAEVETESGETLGATLRERIRARIPAWIAERYGAVRDGDPVSEEPSVEPGGPHPSYLFRYDEVDRQFLRGRVAQFRSQVERRLSGELSEQELKPLRLQNGLYLQLHAYMLRVAIPYGQLGSRQLRRLAYVARRYDRGYGHFTTRQNVQFNWVRLEDMPDILADLAEVHLHSIQTSGNCIRNVTSDPFAGVAADEVEDPRPYCELLRLWSTCHPEFLFLPRKFKVAVSGAAEDRAAVRIHDIGLRLVRNAAQEVGFEVMVGGGLGRTPRLAATIREFLPKRHLLSYCEAILRVYNRQGRRDNLHKARIKILLGALGVAEFARQVETEWDRIKEGPLELSAQDLERIRLRFPEPPYRPLPDGHTALDAARLDKDREFARWVTSNVKQHRVPGYSIVVLPLKATGAAPGDLTANQMEAVAALADRYSFGRVVVTHRQNLVLPDVETRELAALWRELVPLGVAMPALGQISDVITCPGLDYCGLANARSIPVAEEIVRTVRAKYDTEVGGLTLNISGCINACGHHHVGNIGLLGIDKQGTEHYQLSLGGSAAHDASLAKILGPALTREQIVPAVMVAIDAYLELRSSPGESFLETYRRLGPEPFAKRVYAAH